jgi:hypothetical protein
MIDTLPAPETLVNFTFTSGTSTPFTACGLVGTINCTTPVAAVTPIRAIP